MIVNDEKKFVFLHIPKTAGTSVSLALGLQKRPRNPHRVEPHTPQQYAHYLRFCFVRNPWDRLFSSFKYAERMAAQGKIFGDPVRMYCQDAQASDFEAFVMDFISPQTIKVSVHFRPQLRWIAAGAPQFIGRTETIANDTAYLARALNLTDFSLPHENRSTQGDYRGVYTPQMIDRVRSLYRRDVDLLGYTFDN